MVPFRDGEEPSAAAVSPSVVDEKVHLRPDETTASAVRRSGLTHSDYPFYGISCILGCSRRTEESPS
jgi:hypothetical protein